MKRFIFCATLAAVLAGEYFNGPPVEQLGWYLLLTAGVWMLVSWLVFAGWVVFVEVSRRRRKVVRPIVGLPSGRREPAPPRVGRTFTLHKGDE